MRGAQKGIMDNLDELIFAIKSVNGNEDKLTANTVTTINGNIDLSVYADAITNNQDEVIDVLEKNFGNGSNIYKIFTAEIYYQKNECYKALVQAVSAIPFLQTAGEYELLFSAMYIQMCVMIVTGQVNAIYPMIDSMGDWINKSENDELISNHKALGAWCALYDDDWYVIDDWLKQYAPDENAEIKINNVFSLFVKARIYLAKQKNMAAISLLEMVKPLLEKENRVMYLCELNILYSLACYAEGEMLDAFNKFNIAFEISKEYGYDRLVADEGEIMYKFLLDYEEWIKNLPDFDIKKESDKLDYINRLINLSKEMALLYPRYLRIHKLDYEKLTSSEIEVLRLMADDRTNDQIAKFLKITVNTVKFHSKNIFKKLGVKNRHMAVRIAKEEGFI